MAAVVGKLGTVVDLIATVNSAARVAERHGLRMCLMGMHDVPREAFDAIPGEEERERAFPEMGRVWMKRVGHVMLFTRDAPPQVACPAKVVA